MKEVVMVYFKALPWATKKKLRETSISTTGPSTMTVNVSIPTVKLLH